MSKTTEYLQSFKQHAAEWFKKAAFVRQYHAFFKDFFQREKLEQAEWADIQKIGAHLHCFQSMALAKGNALGKLTP
jgi:5-methylcytosine-specific restriction protein B